MLLKNEKQMTAKIGIQERWKQENHCSDASLEAANI